jgi:hypothetical protein
MSMYYDRKGRPMDLMDWARHVEDREYAVVAQHWIRGWMISTVWLGLDHSFSYIKGTPPVIFETMVFPPGDEAGEHGIRSEEYCERYSTEEAAQAGHDRALSWVREKLGDDSASDIMSAAQMSDPWTPPDDLTFLEGGQL